MPSSAQVTLPLATKNTSHRLLSASTRINPRPFSASSPTVWSAGCSVLLSRTAMRNASSSIWSSTLTGARSWRSSSGWALLRVAFTALVTSSLAINEADSMSCCCPHARKVTRTKDRAALGVVVTAAKLARVTWGSAVCSRFVMGRHLIGRRGADPAREPHRAADLLGQLLAHERCDLRCAVEVFGAGYHDVGDPVRAALRDERSPNAEPFTWPRLEVDAGQSEASPLSEVDQVLDGQMD